MSESGGNVAFFPFVIKNATPEENIASSLLQLKQDNSGKIYSLFFVCNLKRLNHKKLLLLFPYLYIKDSKSGKILLIYKL